MQNILRKRTHRAKTRRFSIVFLTSGRMLPLKKVSMQTFCSILVTPRSHVWPEDTKKNSCGKFPKFGKLTLHGHSNHKIGGQKLLIVIIRSGLRILLKKKKSRRKLVWELVESGSGPDSGLVATSLEMVGNGFGNTLFLQCLQRKWYVVFMRF